MNQRLRDMSAASPLWTVLQNNISSSERASFIKKLRKRVSVCSQHEAREPAI